MAVDLGIWNAIVSTVTLVVVAGAAFAALRQIRQLRAQTTLAGLLKVLDDWRDPEFQRIVAYVRNELPQKVQEPGFLDDLEHMPDQEKHPELAIGEWYEQIGSYMKHGLLDETIMLDVASSSTNTMWRSLAPVVERMRRTRGDALWENFEYMAARGGPSSAARTLTADRSRALLPRALPLPAETRACAAAASRCALCGRSGRASRGCRDDVRTRARRARRRTARCD